MQRKFHLNTDKCTQPVFILRVVKHWVRLSRESAKSPSFEMFKSWLDTATTITQQQSWATCSNCLGQESWTRQSPKIPFSLNHSLILCRQVCSQVLALTSFPIRRQPSPCHHQCPCHSYWAWVPAGCNTQGSSAAPQSHAHRLAQRHCHSGQAPPAGLQQWWARPPKRSARKQMAGVGGRERIDSSWQQHCSGKVSQWCCKKIPLWRHSAKLHREIKLHS